MSDIRLLDIAGKKICHIFWYFLTFRMSGQPARVGPRMSGQPGQLGKCDRPTTLFKKTLLNLIVAP